MPTVLRSTVILGQRDLQLVLTALHNRMTHHGRAEARLKTGGYHYMLCERYRALGQVLAESDSVMIVGTDGLGLPDITLPDPEPDPESWEPSEEREQGLPT